MLRAAESVRECLKTARRWILRQQRRASPGARPGSSGGSASGRGFLTFGCDVGFVGACVHQTAEFCGSRQAHLDEPRRAVWISIDFLGRVLKCSIGFDLFAGSRRINLADSLDRLHSAEGLSGFDFRPRLGQLDEDHVAEFMLCVIGDSDRRESALDIDPFMFFRVTVRLGIRHLRLSYELVKCFPDTPRLNRQLSMLTASAQSPPLQVLFLNPDARRALRPSPPAHIFPPISSLPSLFQRAPEATR